MLTAAQREQRSLSQCQRFMIKAIIIDDEVHCVDTLSMLLADCCPEVEIADTCLSAKKGLEAIERFHPDVIFLDIEMPVMNGFEMLQRLDKISFAVIFTTSYDQYAIKAIRFSALDYLLKPIDPKELVTAVNKVQVQKTPPTAEQFRMLMEQIQNKEKKFTKVAVPTSEGFELIPSEEIIYGARKHVIFILFSFFHLCLKGNQRVPVAGHDS